MNKSYALLYLCEQLKEGKAIDMQTCMLVYDISVPTFRRYMADLRAFFTEKYGLEIKYISAKKGYFLTPNPFIENIENQ